MRRETRDAVRDGAIRSAAAVLPAVFEHPAMDGDASGDWGAWPDAMLDVGSGEGHWQTAYRCLRPLGHCLGVDVESREPALGFPFVAPWDAENGDRLPMITGPGAATGTADWETEYRWPLTLCLEMAEHVSPDAGAWLVGELCRVSRIILWSAAIPGQGGDGHVNEQWPSYWDAHFQEQGWMLVDPLRPVLWRDDRIEPWYRQNLLVAIRGQRPRDLPVPLDVAHPVIFGARVGEASHWRNVYLELSDLHDRSLDR